MTLFDWQYFEKLRDNFKNAFKDDLLIDMHAKKK